MYYPLNTYLLLHESSTNRILTPISVDACYYILHSYWVNSIQLVKTSFHFVKILPATQKIFLPIDNTCRILAIFPISIQMTSGEKSVTRLISVTNHCFLSFRGLKRFLCLCRRIQSQFRTSLSPDLNLPGNCLSVSKSSKKIDLSPTVARYPQQSVTRNWGGGATPCLVPELTGLGIELRSF